MFLASFFFLTILLLFLSRVVVIKVVVEEYSLVEIIFPHFISYNKVRFFCSCRMILKRERERMRRVDKLK